MNDKTYGDRDEDVSLHERHLKDMVAYYSRTASRYNSWHCNPANNCSHNYAVRELQAMLRKTGGKSVLDVCCGTGRATKAALDAGYDARGVDISKELIGLAVSEVGVPAERLTIADATKLPHADQSFDVVCILGALHHSARPRAIVAEMLRVARKGLVISDEGNHVPGGIKAVLVRLGIFEPVYRLLFRRPPRTSRRPGSSETDGPTFLFSIDEVLPMVRAHFPRFKCLSFYTVGKLQMCSYHLPRLFARHAVASAWRD